MSQKNNVRMIGIFVVGGILLLVAGIAAFATTELFSRRLQYVMYFDSSLNGLDIGSPVSFRGVDIGYVTNIVMEIDSARNDVNTPVFVEIDPTRFKVSNFSDQLNLLTEPPMTRMIEKGLRAQLQTQSFITGQMYIELEFHPSFPAVLRAGKEVYVDEIPTIPSQLDQVQATLRNVLERIRKLDMEKLLAAMVGTLETSHAAAYEFYEVTSKVNAKIDSILMNVDGASAESREAMVQAQKTLEKLDVAVKSAGDLLVAVSPGASQGVANAEVAFDEMAEAMRALKELAELLERNPDALLTGKQNRR